MTCFQCQKEYVGAKQSRYCSNLCRVRFQRSGTEPAQETGESAQEVAQNPVSVQNLETLRPANLPKLPIKSDDYDGMITRAYEAYKKFKAENPTDKWTPNWMYTDCSLVVGLKPLKR